MRAYLFLAVTAITVLFWPPKNRAFRRRGLDPGFGNLKVWPARLWSLWKGKSIVEQAYLQDKDTPYLLQGLAEDTLVLPPKYLPELRMIPGSKLSASEALVTGVLGQYSGVDAILKDRQHYDIPRVHITKSLPMLVPRLSNKIDEILSETLSQCSTSAYTPIKVKDVVSDLVLRTTLLTFVGPDLCENSQLQFIVMEFANIVRDMAMLMLLRRQARSILFPKTDARGGSDGKIPTVIDHFVGMSETPTVDEDQIVTKFLVLISGALHTTKMSTVHAILDLCTYPSTTQELRREIEQYNPGDNAPWQHVQVNRLKKLDSFLKESQRFNSAEYLRFNRIAMETIVLQDGTTVPQGTFISMPSGPMAMDPLYYSDPQRFCATRFCGIDPDSDASGKVGYSFVGTESGNLRWGHGRFTCPGRWYASAVMKVILAKVIMKYEVRVPDGKGGRLGNVFEGRIVEPNPKQLALFELRG